MYLCQAKNKRVKCKYASKITETVDNDEELKKLNDILPNKYKNTHRVGDVITDWLCLQYHDKPWNKCKCQRAHTKEV